MAHAFAHALLFGNHTAVSLPHAFFTYVTADAQFESALHSASVGSVVQDAEL